MSEDAPSWKNHLWRNLGTGYLSLVLRLFSGFILFRLMFQYLDEVEFGFYAMLWSLFGFMILLDFGLGLAAQKATAQRSETGDQEGLSVLISTIFWSFVGVSVVLVPIALLAEPFVMERAIIPVEKRETFGLVYRTFFIGLAVIFPATTFYNVLAGLQRLDISNLLNIIGTLISLIFLPIALIQGWPFQRVMLISIIAASLPLLISYSMVRRLLPELSIHPKHYNRAALGPVLAFSLAAFLIAFSDVILAKTDQAVVSFTVGVAALTVYQAGFKAAEMFTMVTSQLGRFLAPAAAQLSGRGDKEGLIDLFVRSSGFMLLLATPVGALAAVYLEPLIMLLTGYEEVPQICLYVGWCLIFATWWHVFASLVTKSMLVMTDDEKPLLRFAIIEAVLNLVLSVILVHRIGLLGVAVGTLIPTVIMGWLRLHLLAAPFTGRSVFVLIAQIVRPVLVPIVASLTALAVLIKFFPLPESGLIFELGARGFFVAVVLGSLSYRHIRAFAGESAAVGGK